MPREPDLTGPDATGSDLTGVEPGVAGPGDAAAILRLINLVQPHVPWNEELLRWNYFEPPLGPARIHVIRAGSDVVAMMAALPLRFQVDGREEPGGFIQDAMTHPAYRGRGFLHHIDRTARGEFRAEARSVFGLPNATSERSFRRGWAVHGRVPARRTAVPDDPAGADDRIAPHPGDFDDTDTAIWEAAGLDTGVYRDAAYLRWRYRKPGQTYHRFRIDGDGGFVVLKVYDGGAASVVHVCDLVLRRDARPALERSLRFCFRFARRAGASELTAWLPADHPYAPAFDAAGLRAIPDHDRIVIVMGPAEGRRWHLTQGDSDVY